MRSSRLNIGAANRDGRGGTTGRVRHLPHADPARGVRLRAPHLSRDAPRRAETMVAVNAVLDRLPNVRLDPDAEDIHISGSTFHAPRTLPIVFD